MIAVLSLQSLQIDFIRQLSALKRSQNQCKSEKHHGFFYLSSFIFFLLSFIFM